MRSIFGHGYGYWRAVVARAQLRPSFNRAGTPRYKCVHGQIKQIHMAIRRHDLLCHSPPYRVNLGEPTTRGPEASNVCLTIPGLTRRTRSKTFRSEANGSLPLSGHRSSVFDSTVRTPSSTAKWAKMTSNCTIGCLHYSRFAPSLSRLCRNPRDLMDVMLSATKHLKFSSCYEAEILRLRLRVTLRHSLLSVRRFNY
jgi:hypothetical protein